MIADPNREPPSHRDRGKSFWRAWRLHIITFVVLLGVMMIMYLPNAAQRAYMQQTGVDRRTLIAVACNVRELCARLRNATTGCGAGDAAACAQRDLPKTSLGLCNPDGELALLPSAAQPHAMQCAGARVLDWATQGDESAPGEH